MCLQFGFVIFWQKDFGAKAAHKMLVKLTLGSLTVEPLYSASLLTDLFSDPVERCPRYESRRRRVLHAELQFRRNHDPRTDDKAETEASAGGGCRRSAQNQLLPEISLQL